MKYTVILPTYNEAENVRILIPDILGLGKNYHVLVVDDNSPDGTADLVSELIRSDSRVSLLKRGKKLGLGSAYREGIKEVLKGDSGYIFEMDADLSHDYRDLPRLSESMEKFDIAIGSRYVEGACVENWSLPRLLLSYTGNIVTRLVTGLKISDNTSGFKCFKRHVLESVDMNTVSSNGYAFQIELNYRAAQRGFRLGEIPILFRERVSGVSKLSKEIVIEALLLILRIRIGVAFRKNQ